jgi:hypothetical protein
MQKIIFLSLFLSLTQGLLAQTTRNTVAKTMDKTPNLKLAYLSSIKYPGFHLGVEFPMFAKEKTIIKASGATKTKLKERFLTTDFSFYHHPDFHSNTILSAAWLMRKTRKSGWFVEFSPGIGYSRTFLDATTYVKTDDGSIKTKAFAGNNYFVASLESGLGYNFMLKNKQPIKAFLSGTMFVFAPFNTVALPRPSLELGVISSFSIFKKQ